MTQPEFIAWVEYFRLYPFDDLHRFHRPAALVAQSLGGGEIHTRLDWLHPDPRNAQLGDADLTTLRALGFKSRGG